MTVRWRFCGLLSLSVLLGCASDSAVGLSQDRQDPGSNEGPRTTRCVGANDCPPGQQCNSFGYCSAFDSEGQDNNNDAGVQPPPEVEERLELPASGERYVYVAISDQDMVVRIDSDTLDVQTIKVGDNPGALQTVAGQDTALLLNRNDATATLLSAADDEQLTLPTAEGLNRLAISPDGAYAIAFFDLALAEGTLPGQTLQEVTLLRLGEKKAVDLSVGFRPFDVQFSADNQTAFVITEQGISIIDLARTRSPAIISTIPYAEDPLDDTTPTEVRVTPDGKHALLRLSGKSLLRAVELPSGKILDLPLEAEPTDLDLNAVGDLAIIVLRETNTLAFVEVPEAFADPGLVETVSSEHPFGQATVAADGSLAFLFTNATNEEVLLVADLQTRSISPVLMQKGIRAVRIAPDAKTALVLHNKLPGSPQPGDDAEAMIDKQEGYTLLSIADRFPTKLQITETAVGQTAFAPDSKHGYLLLSDRQADIRLLEAIDLRSFLVDRVELGSAPAGIGVLPATEQIYVAQNHPLGRVTFVDSETHKTRTLTGFALNSQVIE